LRDTTLAAQKAIKGSAYTEAISHINRGLKLLESTPDSAKRIEQELSLHMALGGSLTAIKGFGAPEAGKAYVRGLELSRKLGEYPRLFHALESSAWFQIGRGELQTARQLSEECLRVAHHLKTQSFLQAAYFVMGEVLYDLGELAQSRKHSEQAVILNDPLKLTSPRGFGDFDDIGTSCLVLLTGTLWALGYPEQALGKIRESLGSARELSHPLSQAIALYGATELYVRCRKVEKTEEQAEALIALCRQHGFRLWEALGVAF
jgi:tetratricopeptide (TPR) repeat protein